MELVDLTVFAARFVVRFARPRPGRDVKSLLAKLMSGMALECAAAGASLIGHIKCIAEVPGGAHIACSVLGEDGKAECAGEFPGESAAVVVVLNILLYGLEEARVRDCFLKVLDREVPAASGRFEIMA
jgi:hypothetical protein